MFKLFFILCNLILVTHSMEPYVLIVLSFPVCVAFHDLNLLSLMPFIFRSAEPFSFFLLLFFFKRKKSHLSRCIKVSILLLFSCICLNIGYKMRCHVSHWQCTGIKYVCILLKQQICCVTKNISLYHTLNLLHVGGWLKQFILCQWHWSASNELDLFHFLGIDDHFLLSLVLYSIAMKIIEHCWLINVKPLWTIPSCFLIAGWLFGIWWAV